MSGEAAPAQPIRLPWLSLGPRSQGRNYGVIARTEGLRLSPQAENRLNDFSLALAIWADLAGEGRPEGFACFFPLGEGDPWLLVRGRFLGQGGLGTIAYALGVIVPPELVKSGQIAPHRLLELIPPPDREAPLPLPLDSGRLVPKANPAKDISGLARIADHLNSYLLAVEHDPSQGGEALAAAILDRLGPGPVLGWSDTGSFSRNGAFDPTENFALVVHRPGDAPPQGRHARYRVVIRGAKVVEDQVPPSPARDVWMLLLEAAAQKLARTDHIEGREGQRIDIAPVRAALGGLVWRADLASLSATRIVEHIVHEATALLELDSEEALFEAQLALYVVLADATAGLGSRPKIQEEARVGLAETYRELHAFGGDARTSAIVIETYLSAIGPRLEDVAPRSVTVDAIPSGALPYLSAASLLVLCKRGLVTSLAAKSWPVIANSLGPRRTAPPFRPEALAALMDGLHYHLSATNTEARPESYGLAADILEEAARLILMEPAAHGAVADHDDLFDAAPAGECVDEAQRSQLIEWFEMLFIDMANSEHQALVLRPLVAMALKTDRRPVGAGRGAAGARKLVDARKRYWAFATEGFRRPETDKLNLCRIAVTAAGLPSTSPWKRAS